MKKTINVNTPINKISSIIFQNKLLKNDTDTFSSPYIKDNIFKEMLMKNIVSLKNNKTFLLRSDEWVTLKDELFIPGSTVKGFLQSFFYNEILKLLIKKYSTNIIDIFKDICSKTDINNTLSNIDKAYYNIFGRTFSSIFYDLHKESLPKDISLNDEQKKVTLGSLWCLDAYITHEDGSRILFNNFNNLANRIHNKKSEKNKQNENDKKKQKENNMFSVVFYRNIIINFRFIINYEKSNDLLNNINEIYKFIETTHNNSNGTHSTIEKTLEHILKIGLDEDNIGIGAFTKKNYGRINENSKYVKEKLPHLSLYGYKADYQHLSKFFEKYSDYEVKFINNIQDVKSFPKTGIFLIITKDKDKRLSEILNHFSNKILEKTKLDNEFYAIFIKDSI